MFALVFNTRRTEFHDPRVRQALAYGFDFEWLNRVLYHGSYSRTTSFFDNSEFAANQPISAPERALLAKYRTSLPNAVFTKVYEPPATDDSGKIRQGLRNALALFAEAGWAIRDGSLVNQATGRPMEFEILLLKPWHERLLSSYVRNLKRLGVQAKLRTVDSAQYENRTASFDFDVIVNHWGQSLSPGNEQAIYWGSEAAEDQGSRNYAGIKDPVVDALIEKVVQAHDRDSLIAATRALDRVLLWSYYVMPLFHLTADRVAYWNRFGRPDVPPIYGTTTDLWWSNTSKSK
jgi:microcin C transport system substrate-binding protein